MRTIGFVFPFNIMDLGASFKRYFEVVPAVTGELREQAFRIRHQVYCEELNYEPVRADRREVDEYDAQSLHMLMRSIGTGEYVGCTRLILCRRDDPHQRLPFERTCAGTLDKSIVDPQAMRRDRIGEVSRLAVISRYRLRRGEHRSPAPISEESFGAKLGAKLLPRFPYIPVGLYLATLELAAFNGIDHIFVLTEPRLATHFSRLGVRVQHVGGPVQHRGTRVPSMLDVKEILSGLNFIMRPLHKVIAEEVRQGVREQAAIH